MIRLLRSTVLSLGFFAIAWPLAPGADLAQAEVNFVGLQSCYPIAGLRLDWSSDLGPDYVLNYPAAPSCLNIAGVNESLVLNRFFYTGQSCTSTSNVQISPAGPYAGSPVAVIDYHQVVDHRTGDIYGLGASGAWRVSPQFAGLLGSTTIYWRIDVEVAANDAQWPLRIMQSNHGVIFTSSTPGGYTVMGSSPYSDMTFEWDSITNVSSISAGYSESQGRLTFSFDTTELPTPVIGTTWGRLKTLYGTAP